LSLRIYLKKRVSRAKVGQQESAFADVNGDGLLDIYVCKSGNEAGAENHNELYINNGDLTFTEKAKEYGIDESSGNSTQGVFFDTIKTGTWTCFY